MMMVDGIGDLVNMFRICSNAAWLSKKEEAQRGTTKAVASTCPNGMLTGIGWMPSLGLTALLSGGEPR
jgi:hypothetical protein